MAFNELSVWGSGSCVWLSASPAALAVDWLTMLLLGAVIQPADWS